MGVNTFSSEEMRQAAKVLVTALKNIEQGAKSVHQAAYELAQSVGEMPAVHAIASELESQVRVFKDAASKSETLESAVKKYADKNDATARGAYEE